MRLAAQDLQNANGPAFRVTRDLVHVVRVDEHRRLHSLAVNVNAADDRLGRECARLKNVRPEPGVDPNAFPSLMIAATGSC